MNILFGSYRRDNIFLILGFFCVTALSVESQPVITNGPDYKSSDFRLTIFARKLQLPTSMQQLPDKSLIVATHKTVNGEITGELLRLVDSDKNGIADNAGTILYAGLPGPITSVRRADDLIFVNSRQHGRDRISVLRTGSNTGSLLELIGSINFAYPPPWSHRNIGLAVRKPKKGSRVYELFFNVGSSKNFEKTRKIARVTGLINGNVKGDTIYKVTVKDQGDSLKITDLVQIAAGLRNAAGMAFHPRTGDLYFEDNGIDTPGNEIESFSADELNIIKKADIGGVVEDFGFPNDYIQYRTGKRIGSGGIQPLVTFQPIPNSLNGSESEGAVEIAFAPRRFPKSLKKGVFIGFHGQITKAGKSNEENPVIHHNLAKNTYFHFIGNKEKQIGHPDWLLATVDSLFVGDMSTKGMLRPEDLGVIYQIRYAPK